MGLRWNPGRASGSALARRIIPSLRTWGPGALLGETSESATPPGIHARGFHEGEETPVQIQYLEIVTKDVEAVCAAYEATHGITFAGIDPGLGGARTAALPGGSLLGVRCPLHESEEPVVRPYWLVDDIETALAAAVKAGSVVAHPPLEIPGHGIFAITIQGGLHHGLWQKPLRSLS